MRLSCDENIDECRALGSANVCDAEWLEPKTDLRCARREISGSSPNLPIEAGMTFSFIIPAHNEEALLPATLQAVRKAADENGIAYELIVVDDASTDRTSQIAARFGAQVVSVDFRKISAVRNAGARRATGDVFVFVDADTLVPAATLAGVCRALGDGAVAGGAWVELEPDVPLWGRVLANLVIGVYVRLGHAGGCFLFARREAFETVGGFDESYYATEEVHLSRALRRQGRFVNVREPVITSGRKFRVFSPWDFLKLTVRFLAGGGFRRVQRREGLEMWYKAPRETASPKTGPLPPHA